MRITMVAPFGMQPKGTTRWRVLPLARALSRRSHTVRVVIPSWDHPSDAGRTWRDGSVEVISVPFPSRLGPAGWPLLLDHLLRETMRGAPDIVHVFKPIGFSGAVAEALLRLRPGRRPLIWADADDYEAAWAKQAKPPMNTHGHRFERAENPRSSVFIRVFGSPLFRPQRSVVARFTDRQERWVLSRADAVTAASHALCGLISGWRGSTPFYLPNTSSLATVGQNGILPSLETPGRVVWYTRFLDFPLQGAADLWAEVIRISPGARLHVIGAGFRGEERAFAAAIGSAGLGDTVVFCGWMEGEALAAELAAACVAIFPFATTPINEYKCPARLADLTAAGVPVVAHRVGECSGYVRDGETGITVPSGSAEEFAQSLVRLLADDTTRARMRSAAREHFARHFAPDVLAARLEQAYTASVEHSGDSLEEP